MFNSNLKSNNISFQSIKPNLRLGEKVLKDFKQEFPYMKSSTNVLVRTETFRNTASRNINKKLNSLDKKIFFLDNQIYDRSYQLLNEHQIHTSLKDYVTKLTEFIHNKRNKANCDADCMIIYQKLKEKGLKPKNIEIIVENEDSNLANHFTTVFGLAKDAEAGYPNTWGNKAVIVDAWKGIVMKADDALRYFEQNLLLGKKRINTVYQEMPLNKFVNSLKP